MDSDCTRRLLRRVSPFRTTSTAAWSSAWTRRLGEGWRIGIDLSLAIR
jgi:hypothetical protein